MKLLLKASVVLIMLSATSLGHAQESAVSDALRYTIDITQSVHFFDQEGQDVLVPGGAYWVSAQDGNIQLLNLESGEAYLISAESGSSDDDLPDARAVSVAGTDDDPDTHQVVLTFFDGTELVAEGSYSGIRTRGICGQVCQDARRKARNAAIEARRRAEQAAAQARRAAELAAQRSRDNARQKANALLREIAAAAARNDRGAVARLTATAAPRLAILAPASMSAQQTAQLLAEARRQLAIQRPFIEEVARRIQQNRALFSVDGQSISTTQAAEIVKRVLGEGDNQLPNPFATQGVRARGISESEVTPRGESAVNGFAVTVGASWDVGAIFGVGAGGSTNITIFPFSIFVPNCTYGDATASVGAELSAGVNADIGFWARNVQSLGGPSASVDIGGALGLGVDIGFNFEPGGLLGFSLSGITLSPGAGAGLEASLSIGYSELIGCGNLLLL